jgi:NADH-quinone oxidoreductase subunit C
LPADRRGADVRRVAVAEENPQDGDDTAMSDEAVVNTEAQQDARMALADYIAKALPEALQHAEVIRGELIVHAAREQLLALLTFLRDDKECLFRQLVDITGVDYPDRPERFEVVYNLLSLTHNRRIRVKVHTDAQTPVPSCVGVFPTANWLEREVWDMYGVLFAEHPDLRRILTDYGFIGHPFRKDFPISGNVEMRYDTEQKRVVYQPVTIEPREVTPRIVREEGYGIER